jgi:hypothetical protein
MVTPGSVVVVAAVEEVDEELDDELLVDCATEDSVGCPEAGGVEAFPPDRKTAATAIAATSTTIQAAIRALRRAIARLRPLVAYIDRRLSIMYRRSVSGKLRLPPDPRQAEGAGFEPARPCGLPVFKTGAINQAPPPLRAHRQLAGHQAPALPGRPRTAGSIASRL